MRGSPSTRTLGLVLAALCAPQAFAQGVQLDPGALIALDSGGAKQGVYHIVQFSPAGHQLSDLATGYPVPFYGVMAGLTVVDGEVWTIGTGSIVARIDLDTGAMKDTFFANEYSPEALTTIAGDLLIGAYTGHVKRVTTGGQTVSTIETGIPMTGLATDGTSYYCGNYQNGHIYVFDQAGHQTGFIPTNIGGYSMSGLTYDDQSATLLATTGFGADDVRRYSLNGQQLEAFAPGWTYLNDVDLVPHACTDLFVPEVSAGASLSLSGHALPQETVAVCVALARSAEQPFSIAEFCGASLLSPIFGDLQLLTTTDVEGVWSIRILVPDGISFPVHVQAFPTGVCPAGCSSTAVTRLIE